MRPPIKSLIKKGIDFLKKVCYTEGIMKKLTQKSHQMTLAALAVGALIAPIQSALSDVVVDSSADTHPAKIQVEHHPHSTDPGSWQNHYVDPRSIRAVGHDSGKSTTKNDLQNPWRMYQTRTV
jgi:hypothetical protein